MTGSRRFYVPQPRASVTVNVGAAPGLTLGAPASSIGQTVTSSAGKINWNPGHYFVVGNEAHTNGVADNQNIAGIISNLEKALIGTTGSLIQGFMGIYRWTDLETAPGVFGGLATHIDPMVSWCQARNYSWSIAINTTGNASNGGSTIGGAPSDMIDNSTYGDTTTANYHGAVWQSATAGPVINFTNKPTMDRLAALGAAIWSRYGTSIFAFQPVYSEISFGNGIADNWSGTNGDLAVTNGLAYLAGKIRAAMPNTYIPFSCTYLPFNNPQYTPILLAAMRANSITGMNFDSCNENTVGGWVNPKVVPFDMAFRGLKRDGTTLVDQSGNPQSSMVGTYDFATHTSEDALGPRPRDTGGTVGQVPQAHIGDGRLGAILAHDNQQQTSHKFWAPNYTGGNGPNCNRITRVTGINDNYTDNSNVGHFTNLVGGIQYTYGVAVSRTSYPAGFQQ